MSLVVAGRPVAEVVLADTPWRRFRGMLARRRLPAGMIFVPGGSVHGLGMTTSLDVALLAPVPVPAARRPVSVLGEHRVVRTARLRPFGIVASAPGVRTVLEAPAGSFARWGLHAGAVVALLEPQP